MPRPEPPWPYGLLNAGPTQSIPWSEAAEKSSEFSMPIGRLQSACTSLPTTAGPDLEGPRGSNETFESWLQNLLSSERSALVTRLQWIIGRQLTEHHTELAKAIKTVEEHTSALDFTEAAESPSYPEKYSSNWAIGFSRLSTRLSNSRASVCTPATLERSSTMMDPAKRHSELGSARDVMACLESKGAFSSNSGSRTFKSYKSDYLASLVTQSVSHHHRHIPSVSRIVGSHYFELTVSFMILLNVLMTALEVQHVGCLVGHSIGHPDCSERSDDFDRIVEWTFQVCTIFFTSAFAAEFILRMMYHGAKVCCQKWMWFDAFCLMFGIADVMSRMDNHDALVLNPTVMRVTRIIRMLRIVKFFRSKEVFQTLFLLMKSILASRHTLVWFILILYLTITCIGLLMNQLLYAYLLDETADPAARREVYEYFGTYTRMIITMFEITLGNWPIPTRVLMDHVSQWWGIFVVVYRCVFCFSLVNTTLAVFINETSRVAADDQVQMIHKLRRDRKVEATLSELFTEIDTSEDGQISLEELRAAAEDKVMTDIMEIHGFDIQDVEELFHLMDKGEGKVPQQRIVQGIMRFSGAAKGSRQLAILRLIKNIDAKVDSLSRCIEHPNG